MEILSRGTLPEEREHIATCGYCNTKIKFIQSEAKYVPDQRDGDFLTIGCPVCSRQIRKSVRS